MPCQNREARAFFVSSLIVRVNDNSPINKGFKHFLSSNPVQVDFDTSSDHRVHIKGAKSGERNRWEDHDRIVLTRDALLTMKTCGMRMFGFESIQQKLFNRGLGFPMKFRRNSRLKKVITIVQHHDMAVLQMK